MSNYGLWSKPEVPHKGWRCDRIEYEKGPIPLTCQMCQSAKIRFVHAMSHDDYFETLYVGCECASNMEQDKAAATIRDKKLRSKVAKIKRLEKERTKFVDVKWNVSKNNNYYFKHKGYLFLIKKTLVGYVISYNVDYCWKPKNKSYKTGKEVKNAAFEIYKEIRTKEINSD